MINSQIMKILTSTGVVFINSNITTIVHVQTQTTYKILSNKLVLVYQLNLYI